VPALALALLIAAPATASATTFCVAKPSCVSGGGTSEPNLQTALQAAEDDVSAPRDRVEVGPGTFTAPSTGGFANDAGSKIDLVGSGAAKTILTTPAGGSATVLTISEPDSTVSDLLTRLASGMNGTGINLKGLAERVDIRAASGAADGTGVRPTAASALLRRSSVSFPVGPTQPDFTGVNGQGTAEDLSVTARTGFSDGSSIGNPLLVRRARVTANRGASSFDGEIQVDDVLFVLQQGPGSADPVGLRASTDLFGEGTLTARQVTLVGDGSPGSIGIDSSAAEGFFLGGGGTANTTVSNTIVRGFGTHVRRAGTVDCDAPADCLANLTVEYSDYDFSKTSNSGPGSFSGGAAANNVDNVDPRFVGASDYRLRGDSALIDAGEPGGLDGGESSTDQAGKPRLRDGKAPFSGVRRDMGALEYQRLAPTARASVSPTSVATGQAASFDGRASTDPDGEPVNAGWRFDDSTGAFGSLVGKAFTGPGRHGATLVVTDPAGLSDSATTALNVFARPDKLPPDLTVDKDDVKFKGSTLRVKISCDASEQEPCEGVVSAATAKRLTLARKKKLKLGRKKFSIAPGKTRTVKVKIGRRKLKRLRKKKKVAVRVTITAKDDAGNVLKLKRKATLKIKKKKKR
jgi:hypothetical protein